MRPKEPPSVRHIATAASKTKTLESPMNATSRIKAKNALISGSWVWARYGGRSGPRKNAANAPRWRGEGAGALLEFSGSTGVAMGICGDRACGAGAAWAGEGDEVPAEWDDGLAASPRLGWSAPGLECWDRVPCDRR